MIDNDDVRKLKVSELNRILPMVRKTIEKEKHINQIKKELNEKTDLLEKTDRSITQLNELPQLISEEAAKNLKQQFQLLKASQKEQKMQLESLIDLLNKELEEATAQWKFETSLYKSITSAIVTEGGFLKLAEIQEEFLKEYIYLLLFTDSFNNGIKLTMDTLFQYLDDKFYFYELVDNKFSATQAKILSFIDNGTADRTLFFKFFS
ncbi:MAG: hypothetical protein IJE05_03090 [Clostridia bacterium]|nr:hypothetical protein [Clostridia bacterium]